MLPATCQRATWLPLFLCTIALALAALAVTLTPPTARAEPGASKGLTPAMQAEFGAAAWIPADAGFFGAGYRYEEQWQAFTKTNTYQELLTLPAVQMGLAWLRGQPYLAQLERMREQSPLLDQGINVLQDAFSQEAFVYVDSRGPGFFREVGDLYGSIYLEMLMEAMRSRSFATPGDVQERMIITNGIQKVLAAQDDLHVPGVVFGFRLSDPQAGRDLIANLKPLLSQAIPMPLQEESLGGGEYLTLSLHAEMFLGPQIQDTLEVELIKANLDAEAIGKLIQFIKSQTVSISIGMRGDYLILSVGADTSHLSSMGTGVSLAKSEALAPIRKHFQSRLVGLSYLHPEFTNSGKINVKEHVADLQEMLQDFQADLPDGLAERLTTDAKKFLYEINDLLPEAQPFVAASFWNEGFESFSFSALAPGSLDASGPLSILAHAGPTPLLAFAAKSPPSLNGYNRLAYWIQNLYGYFEEYAVPRIPLEDLAHFKRFEKLLLPAVQEFHAATRDAMLPALDGGQSLFLLDAGGAFNRNPKTKEIFELPIRFPRPALVVEVKNTQLLLKACRQYREIFNRLMIDLSVEDPEITAVQLPPPESRAEATGTLYTYPIPSEFHPGPYLDDDFEPHFLLTSEYLVFLLSPRHSSQLLASHALAPGSLIDFEEPAGRAAWFDCLVMKDLVCDDVHAVLSLMEEEKAINPQQSFLIRLHVDKLRKALDAIHYYCSRVYEEDGLRVCHSWLKLQDIEP